MSRRFALLLALFVVGAALQTRALPPMEGSDEPLHAAYVAYLRAEHRLPDRSNYLQDCTRQQSGQPPLVYVLGAVLLDALRAPNPGCDATFTYYYEQTDNPWALAPRPTRRDDNNRNFLPVSTLPPPDGLPGTLYALRLMSVVFGAVGVVAAYLAAGEVFRREEWRLLTAAVFAFTPTYLHVSAYFSNDPAAAALTTLVVWRALHLLNRGVTVRRLLIVGVLAGVGSLAKASVFLALGAVAVAVLFAEFNAHERRPLPTLRAAVVDGLWVALPVLLTFGVWVVWGTLTYGDPLGTGTHVHPVLRYDPPLGWGTTLRTMPDVYLTYVGLLGYANVYMHPATYAALTAVLALALLGYALATRRVNTYAVVLFVLWVATFIGFLRWYRVIYDVTGRLLLPAHIAFALMIVGGVAVLAGRVPKRGAALRVSTAGVFLAAGLLATFTSLHAAYPPRFITASALPPLRGTPYTFDNTLRLLGYHRPGGDEIPPNAKLDTVTLCWEVLQPTDRLAAYAVRYVKDGIAAGNRTTVHGLGKYNSTQWQAGAVFCDAVDVPIGDPLFGAVPPEPGNSYDVLVFLLDADTGDVNWQATTPDGTPVPFPVVGQVSFR